MLNITNLSAAYGKTQVLHDISVSDFAPGQVVGLIGPNAAGKSTLFRALAGIHPITSGEVTVHDKSLSNTSNSEWSRIIGMMPQQYDAQIALTVFDSILLALKNHSRFRVSGDDLDAVSAILEELHINHLAERRLDELSGGQKQMAAIARILVRQPPVALLDEPTSALDLHHQLSAMQIIADVTRRRELVTIVAMHDLNLAAAFCGRLLLLNQGKLLLDDTPERVLEHSLVAETYQVNLTLERSQREALFVDAWLHPKH